MSEIIDIIITTEELAGNFFPILVLGIALTLAIFSFYYAKMQKPYIKGIDVVKQISGGPAHHTIVLSNYGSKGGVVTGPKIKGEATFTLKGDLEPQTQLIKAHSTIIRKITVESTEEKNTDYQLEFGTQDGKVIQLPKRTYLAEIKKLTTDKKLQKTLDTNQSAVKGIISS